MRFYFGWVFVLFLAFSCQKKGFPVEDFSIFEAIVLSQNEQQIFLNKNTDIWLIKTTLESSEELVSIPQLNDFFFNLHAILLLEENTEFLCENPLLISFFSSKKELVLRYWFADFGEKTCFSYQWKNEKIHHYWAKNSISLENFAVLFSLNQEDWLERQLLSINSSELEKVEVFFSKKEENIKIEPDENHFFVLKNNQGQKISVEQKDLLAYLSFFQKIQFLQLVSEDLLKDYEIDFTEEYATLQLLFTQKNTTHQANFKFFPLKKADGTNDMYKCFGIFNQNGVEKKYIFSYFHLDLFLKNLHFFETLNQ